MKKLYSILLLFSGVFLIHSCNKDEISDTITDIDGNVYKTVTIGTQVWMAENLRTTKYNDGTGIPLVTDNTAWSNLATPGYCWYNNDEANNDIYGAMYNGFTVQTGKLCPAGWHVPTHSEFVTLSSYLIANGYNYDGTTTGNKVAKSMAATTRWTSSTNTGVPGNVLSTNNSSGFSGLPAGIRAYSGIYLHIGDDGYWYSATTAPPDNGDSFLLNYAMDGLYPSSGPILSGMSVRCLKN